ncbi:SGNH/GDSL hydrolase family protein [Rufibacter aurantiacus]|uniref:SGNH/GDSL hydrolase family protein n=1 Tax=Rufibacter aurantiacus TaxID=2817374 RepID=UPI001B307CB5|nr:SGNH/GDSL hydrolase family protein [Rufibacter aurantiacus]
MKNIFYRLGAAALLSTAFLFSGCEPEFEEDITLSKGPLDFSKYVSVGNSLTAGYQDNGLYLEGQVFSYPNILANQFSFVGGGQFVQPLFTQAQANGSGYLRLGGFSSTGAPILAPVTTNLAVRGMGADGKTALLTRFTDLDKIQNFGVPGIKLADIKTAGYGLNNPIGFNPYFERILPENSPATYLQRVSGNQHTFFSSWLGNNDVLGYATAGGFAGSITPVATFTSLYTELITAMTANGAEGIVATIPDVRSVPFFTTVGPTAKPLLASAVAAAKAAGLPITGVTALTKNTAARIVITPESIKDASGGNILLTLTSSAYLPLIGQPTGRYWRELAVSQNPSNPSAQLQGYLSAFQIDTTKAFGLDPRNPVPSAFVLDTEEQNEITTATTAYNAAIVAQANAKSLAVFDAYTFFNSIQSGFTLNGVGYSPAFITGNLFSLDGVHPTPRGYAIIANEMIKAINAKYGSSVPTIDVTQFRAVLIP